ncbi:hypothetical protein ON010_g14151 [Phytophthora cinnamomi]|nr:hypothetical protein ON010_g14151 [Phytophthora cinnamomi]
MLSVRPSSFHAPSTWYDAVADPKRKSEIEDQYYNIKKDFVDVRRHAARRLPWSVEGVHAARGVNGNTAGRKDDCFTLWIHGASVGECLSALPLVELALGHNLDQAITPSTGEAKRKVRVVLSTTTAAARQLLSQRLKENKDAVCVLAPLDHPRCVERFYDAWQPDAGIWIESELWPTLITDAKRRGIRIGLINGANVAAVVSFVADAGSASVFTKCASPLSLSDEAEVSTWRRAIGVRPAWVVASTHGGEEVMMAEVHADLSKRVHDSQHLLTVIIPRHPTRTPAIVKQLHSQFPELSVGLRSRDGLPTNSIDLFIVDTMGETNLVYDAISTAVIGGTFVKRGGHNPIEPLRAGCHVLTGPHMENFADILLQLKTQYPVSKSLRSVSGLEELAAALYSRLKLLDDRPVNGSTSVSSSSHAGHGAELTRAMAELAVSTLSLHELRLISWLANGE